MKILRIKTTQADYSQFTLHAVDATLSFRHVVGIYLHNTDFLVGILCRQAQVESGGILITVRLPAEI